jgi:hypothetical protein
MNERLTDLQWQAVVQNYWDLVGQTAEFRHRICWQSIRDLFAARGFDPSSIIQVTCDQGHNVHGTFVLADGSVISCDFREDPETRQATAFESWKTIACSISDEDSHGLALQICGDPRLKAAFDSAVQAFFEFHWRARDRALPPPFSSAHTTRLSP